jgi:YggT family protein
LRQTGICECRFRSRTLEDTRVPGHTLEAEPSPSVVGTVLLVVGTVASAANTRPMGAYASLGLLADAASSLQSFVTVFVSIYILCIFAWVLLSWIHLPYSTVAGSLQRFLDEVVRPYIGLFRGRIPTLGPLDLSPIVAVIVLLVAAQVVNALIGALL